MSAEENNASHCLARLQIATEPDPGTLPRLLADFQNLNLIPRRVIAECGIENLHISIDVFGLSEDRLTILAGRFSRIPTVLSVYWHRL